MHDRLLEISFNACGTRFQKRARFEGFHVCSPTGFDPDRFLREGPDDGGYNGKGGDTNGRHGRGKQKNSDGVKDVVDQKLLGENTEREGF